MKKSTFILLSFIFFSAYATQENINSSQISQTKHFIYGKWQSEKINLTVSKNQLLEINWIGENGYNYQENYRYEIIDKNTVRLIDNSQPKYKLSIIATAQSDDLLRIDCRQINLPDGRRIIDFPVICNRTFQRLNE